MKDENDKKDTESGPLSGIVREMALTGLATFFMTEDSVRRYLKDLKLPKDVTGSLLESVSKRKDDLYALIAKEVGRFLNKADFEKALGKFLEGHRVNVTASVTFEPRGKGEDKS